MAEEQAAPPPEENKPAAPPQPAAPARELPKRMSIEDAVNVLNEDDAPAEPQEGRQRDERGRFLPEGKEEGDEEPTSEAAGSEPGDEPEESDEDAEPPEEQSDGETDGDEEAEEQLVAGEAKTRLRDGTVVPVAELKKAFEDLQEVKRGGIPSEIRQEIDKVASDLQQRQQYLDKTLPLAIQALKSAVPPEPDDALWDADPIEAQIQQRKHDKAVKQLQELTGAGKEAQEKQQQEQQEQFRTYIQEQQKRLHEARPELKDPQKAQEFYDRYVKVGAKMGFSKEELDQTYDTRLINGVMTLAEKAEKWDRLQQKRPQVVDKTKRAVPMAKPGRRVEPEHRKSAEVESFRRRFNESHSIEDAVALIGKLNL
jgi:hypothetical protein